MVTYKTLSFLFGVANPSQTTRFKCILMEERRAVSVVFTPSRHSLATYLDLILACIVLR